MKLPAYFLAILLVIFTACKKEKSRDVNPDHVQQDIRVYYDADNEDSYFAIRFYDLQWYNRVILEPPAAIHLNGNQMVRNEINSFYELTHHNQKIENAVFQYRDAWNRIFTNTVPIQKPVELPHIDTIYTNKENKVIWEGPPCAGGSEVITLSHGILLQHYFSTSTAGATSITFKAAGSGQAGWTLMRIERKSHSSIQQGPPVGGTIINTYYSKIRWVYIK